MSEIPLPRPEEPEVKPPHAAEASEATEVVSDPSWNPEFDSEIEDAAGQLSMEALNPFGGDPSWNETQQSFTDADWAEARRRASETMRRSRSTDTGVWAGEAEEWRMVALDAQDAAEASEKATK